MQISHWRLIWYLYVRRSYLGYRIFWTGWRRDSSSLCEFGQWVARRRDDEMIYYASVPGTSGTTRPGYVIDISLQQGQKLIDSFSAPAAKRRAKREAGLRLIQVLDAHCSPAARLARALNGENRDQISTGAKENFQTWTVK
jgi:hypothetical protein